LRLSKKVLRALAKNDLIGLEAAVVRSSDPSLEGISGTIIDETMNTLELSAGGRTVKLDKKSVVLSIGFPEGKMEISGSDILQRPEERLKKLWTKVK